MPQTWCARCRRCLRSVDVVANGLIQRCQTLDLHRGIACHEKTSRKRRCQRDHVALAPSFPVTVVRSPS